LASFPASRAPSVTAVDGPLAFKGQRSSAAPGGPGRQHVHHLVEVHAPAFLTRWEFLEGLNELPRKEASAERRLTHDERGATRRTGLLSVVIGEKGGFPGDPVDVGRAPAHHPAMVGADIPDADVIAKDDDDVRFPALRGSRSRCSENRHRNRASMLANRLIIFISSFLVTLPLRPLHNESRDGWCPC